MGLNRDSEDLPQINTGMVCSQENGLPFFYNTFPGSIVDASTIKNTLKYLEEYKLKDLYLSWTEYFSVQPICWYYRQSTTDNTSSTPVIQPEKSERTGRSTPESVEERSDSV
jgi:transposase